MNNEIAAWVDGKLVPMDKLAVHRAGLRHPAVSVFLMDGNRTLIQRRALGKYHTPGLWANACCTHPHWGEGALACAQRRIAQELGISGVTLIRAGGIEYRADVGAGLIEHEVVDIFVGQMSENGSLTQNPDEVMDARWIDMIGLREEIAQQPEKFTPWLKIYLANGLVDELNPI